MPDPIPTSSDPAASVAPPTADSIDQAPVSTDSLDSLNEAQLTTWRTTGVLPDSPTVTTPTAAPSAAEPGRSPTASTDATAQPAGSDPAAPTTGAAARIPELLRDRALEKDRADRAERRLAELESRARPADARPAAPSAASPGLTRPDPETFAYGTSDPDYLEALTDYKVAASEAARVATAEATARVERARTEQVRVATEFATKAAAARAKHPDFDAVALLAPTEIPQGSAIDLYILEDPAGADILYHLQQPANKGELRRILALAPLPQLQAVVRLGDRLSADPATRSTQAPPPADTLTTRSTATDDVVRALADDDTGAYMAAMNRRDLAARKQR